MNEKDYIDDKETLMDSEDYDDDDDYEDDEDDDYDSSDTEDNEVEDSGEVEEEPIRNSDNAAYNNRGFSYGQNQFNRSDIERINNREKYQFGNQGLVDENKRDTPNSNGGTQNLNDKNGADKLDEAGKAKDATADKAKEGATDKAKEGAADKAKEAAADKAKEGVADKAKEAAVDKAKDAVADKAKEEVVKKAAEGAASKGGMALKIKILFWAVVVIFALLLIIATISGIVFIVFKKFGLDKYIMSDDSEGSSPVLTQEYTPDQLYLPVGSEDTSTTDDGVFADQNPPETKVIKTYGIQPDGTTHKGIDLATNHLAGVDNVIAIDDGEVSYAKHDCSGWEEPTAYIHTETQVKRLVGESSTSAYCGAGYGNYVKILHSNGTYTLYAHLYENSVTVKEGDKVKKGQVIGKIGSTGTSTPHLHFEYLTDSTTTDDPTKFVSVTNPRPAALTNIKFVQGENNKQSVCLSLLKTGFSENAVAGILSNMASESRFKTNNPGDHGTSNGLCQWHNSRLTNLKNHCGSTYLESISCQLDFFLKELKSRSEYKYMIDNHSAYDMGYEFCYKFERPAKKETSCIVRGNNARDKYLSYVKNGCK